MVSNTMANRIRSSTRSEAVMDDDFLRTLRRFQGHRPGGHSLP